MAAHALKYKAWYAALMKSRKSNPTFSPYTEVHHILPRSLGGSDDGENLVRLTYREHFVAHWLLTKFHDGVPLAKMQRALFAMALPANGSRIVSGWQFDVAKRAVKDLVIATQLRVQAEQAQQLALDREREACVRRFLDRRNAFVREANDLLAKAPTLTSETISKIGRRKRRRPRPSKRARIRAAAQRNELSQSGGSANP